MALLKEVTVNYLRQWLHDNIGPLARKLIKVNPELKNALGDQDGFWLKAMSGIVPLVAAVVQNKFHQDIDAGTLKGILAELGTDLSPELVQEVKAAAAEASGESGEDGFRPIGQTAKLPPQCLVVKPEFAKPEEQGKFFHPTSCTTLVKTKMVRRTDAKRPPDFEVLMVDRATATSEERDTIFREGCPRLTTLISMPKLDRNGNQILDRDGNPVMINAKRTDIRRVNFRENKGDFIRWCPCCIEIFDGFEERQREYEAAAYERKPRTDEFITMKVEAAVAKGLVPCDCCKAVFEMEAPKMQQSKFEVKSKSFTYWLGLFLASKDPEVRNRAQVVRALMAQLNDAELTLLMEIDEEQEAFGALWCNSREELVAYAKASRARTVQSSVAQILGFPSAVIESAWKQAKKIDHKVKESSAAAAERAQQRLDTLPPPPPPYEKPPAKGIRRLGRWLRGK